MKVNVFTRYMLIRKFEYLIRERRRRIRSSIAAIFRYRQAIKELKRGCREFDAKKYIL